jgi:hypothetical protein
MSAKPLIHAIEDNASFSIRLDSRQSFGVMSVLPRPVRCNNSLTATEIGWRINLRRYNHLITNFVAHQVNLWTQHPCLDRTIFRPRSELGAHIIQLLLRSNLHVLIMRGLQTSFQPLFNMVSLCINFGLCSLQKSKFFVEVLEW